MKLGHIDYLNCYPFYYHAFEKAPLQGITIFSDYPARLNSMLTHGALDMSPVSAATCADIGDDILLLPDFCLSSIGYVGSVILISKFPIEDLNGKKVGLTSASHTSVVLLKALLKKYYKQEPEYIKSHPRPLLKDMDAALVIGNDAMAKASGPIPYTYDLGDLWLRKTGFPVVFAVFAVREKIINHYATEIKLTISSYYKSLSCLRDDKKHVIEKAEERYPDIVYDLDNYYDLLKFEFTDDLKDALMFYYSLAGELGLVRKVNRLRFLEF